MDIHLADGSSFEIFEKAEIISPIIFATAYDEYALKAFKVNAIDYLLKPIKAVELEQAIQKVAKKPRKPDSSDNLVQKLTEAGFIKKNRRVLVRMGQAIKLVDLDQVSFFYSKDKISFAVMPGNKRYPLDQEPGPD
jgi:two-component system LytT family response regulator